jgi:hypothetical protein
MRRLLLVPAAALGIVACTQSAVPPPAHIVGTNSLVVVNDLLFVTSPGAAELRALDLRISPRDFVRAPNPLEPLSIPVLDSPTSLARDIDYNADGYLLDDRMYNPYVYVKGAASAEISVVGTRRDKQLVELKRLVASGIVTAIAARAPPGGDPAQPSTLYFATWNGSQGNLWQQSIPPTDPTTGRMSADPGQQLPLGYGAGGSTVGESVSSILVLPNNRIAVASRAPGSPNGRTIILDASQQRGQQWVLQFPTPVRQLATHTTANDPNADGNPIVLRAGARIFGVLDEDACGTSTDCPGIIAVDGLESSPRFTMRSFDGSGAPMLPIRFGVGLTSTVSLAPSLYSVSDLTRGVALAINSSTVQRFPLLGIVTSGSGFIYFFDANNLNLVNTRTSAGVSYPNLGAFVVGLVYYDDVSPPNPRTYVPGPIPGDSTDATNPAPAIQVALGAAFDEFVFVTYQGIITGFRDLPTSSPDGVIQLPFGSADTRRLIAGKDRIQINNTATESEGICTEVALTGVNMTTGLLEFSGGPIQCPSTATFSVRAGGDQPGDQPYVVEGTVTGYLGRTGNNQTFAFPTSFPDIYARYFYHQPPGDPVFTFDPTNPQPQIQFSMGPGDLNIKRDYHYSFQVNSNYAANYITVDLSIGIEFHAPGASAYVGALPDNTDISRIYVAYPAANAVLEFAPELLIPNNPNSRNIAAFR